MPAFVYDIVFYLPLCIISLLEIGGFFDIEEPEAGLFCIMLAVGIVCELFHVLKTKGRLIMLSVVLITALTTYFLVGFDMNPERYNELVPYINSLLMAFVCFGVMLFLVKYRPVRVIFIAALAVAALVLMVLGIELQELSVAAGLFLVLATVLDLIQVKWKKSGYTEPRRHFVFILPFIIVLMLIVYVIPASEKPYDWNFVKKIAGYIKEQYTLYTKNYALEKAPDYFDTVIGFSDKGTVGGDNNSAPEEMLKLYFSSGYSSEVYLSGKIFDTFTGREWLCRNTSELNDGILDRIASRACATAYTSDALDILRNVDARVEFLEQKTVYAFIPAKGYIEKDEEPIETYNLGMNTLFTQKKGYKSSYQLHFYKLNRNSEVFLSFIRGEHRLKYQDWKREASTYSGGNEELYPYEQFEAWKQMIAENYGTGVTLSKELREYMDEIFEGAADDMDKLIRIETLLKGFNYTTTPGDLPTTVTTPEDFLDYFILHKREGFCTYYATAFVLLARAEGIPARYVQGYYVKGNNKSEVAVTSDMSHAWPEVYIDNFGWVGFEPTPGYGTEINWMTREESKALMEKLREAAAEHNLNDYEDAAVEEDIQEPEEDEDEAEAEAEAVDLRLILFPLSFCMAAFIIFKLLERLVVSIRFRRETPLKRLADICHRNMRLLSHCGYRLNAGETLEEFGKRVMSAENLDISAFIRNYELLSYSTIVEEEQSVRDTYRVYLELVKLFRNKRLVKYLLYRINTPAIRL